MVMLLAKTATAAPNTSNYNLLETSTKGQIYDPYKIIENGDVLVSARQGDSKFIYAKKRYNTYKGYATIQTTNGYTVNVYMRTYHTNGDFGDEQLCEQQSKDETSFLCNLPLSDHDQYLIRISAVTTVINAQVHLTSWAPW